MRVENVPDVMAIKRAHGIPGEAYGCHTAEVDGYLVEGHVPADAIDRLLAERPDLAGVAVPGMPPGSPGMAPGRRDLGGYEILGFTARGETRILERR